MKIGWHIPAFLAMLALPAVAADYELRPDSKLQINSVLASVNGEPVSLEDILPATRQQEYQAYAAYSGDRLYEAIRSIRRKAVDDLINRKLVIADYRQQPFAIPNQQIEEELDNVAERMGYRSRSEFIRQARQSGSSIERLRRQVEENMIYQLMLYRRYQIEQNITPREVYEYYQQHRGDFVRPESLELGMILLPANSPEQEATAEKVGGELKADSGRFAELARLYSAGPGAENGGTLGRIERRRLRPEFAAAMPDLSPGRVYGPVRTAEGIFFLKVIAHFPEEQSDFRKLAPEIRARLEENRREKSRERYFEELRKDAVLRYFFGK